MTPIANLRFKDLYLLGIKLTAGVNNTDGQFLQAVSTTPGSLSEQ
jgi:hypothetical protein